VLDDFRVTGVATGASFAERACGERPSVIRVACSFDERGPKRRGRGHALHAQHGVERVARLSPERCH